MRSYEADFAGWAEDTARAILDGRWSEIDRASLADEVESLAKRDRREIRGRFETLFVHLLKSKYQPERRSRSWNSTILTQRDKLRGLLEESPSLETAAELQDSMQKAYFLARRKASVETGMAQETFPEASPFTEQEIWG